MPTAGGLLARLGGLIRPAPVDPALDAAVDHAIERVEPRLRLFSGYPARYRKAVARGLEYARELAGCIPGPVELNPETFNRDPRIHAMFVSLQEVMSGMCVSQEIRDYRRAHPLPGEVYALLGTRRWEKNVLGMEVDGDILRRDVPQVVVYFNDHTLASPAPSEAEAREAMAWSFFDGLLKHVRRRIDARLVDKVELDKARDELLARLRSRPPGQRAALQAEYDALLARQRGLGRQLDMSTWAEDFDAILLEPEQHLYLTEVAMRLDGMGVLRQPEDPVQSTPMTFADLVGFDRRRWTVNLVHCVDLGQDSISDRLESACRILSL